MYATIRAVFTLSFLVLERTIAILFDWKESITMITTSVTEAAECLQQGQVLAYPTEAVWGLGCDPFNEQAFQKFLNWNSALLKRASFYWLPY